ncbi:MULTISPECIES: CAP domain-containing protein [Nostocales]|uniref:SCP domain-containing protein n=3 Tax=Nostocales TaxID=1161 RepID=A0A0C1NCV0_9CYAN
MNRNFIHRIVELTNTQRRQAGLPELRFNPVLAAAAQKHSVDMALEDFFSHNSPDGSKVSDRAKAEGYPSAFVGENIYAGGSEPEDAFKGWMNSQGHRNNILNPQYKEIGVGYYFLANDTGNVNYKHYWTQCFGSP